MLNRLSQRRCLECGRLYGDPDFTYHAGRIEKGPAYWTDEGVLCSHACSVAHFKRRNEEGRPMAEPADETFPKG
ncbi:hypothetical protein [Microvirga flavescens]|uniref:hypothetical protein n=1 Tax=Microvirga flavescens TaxID=2249811 RepID=UPI000DD5CB57|nr:hypothetical protein [Microvirga flavescens]